MDIGIFTYDLCESRVQSIDFLILLVHYINMFLSNVEPELMGDLQVY